MREKRMRSTNSGEREKSQEFSEKRMFETTTLARRLESFELRMVPLFINKRSSVNRDHWHPAAFKPKGIFHLFTNDTNE